MPRRNKYRPGPTLNTVIAVVDAIVSNRWIYLHDRPKHPSIYNNMSLGTLRGLARFGYLRLAIRNVEPVK